MKVVVTKDYTEMCKLASRIFAAQITLKPDSVLGLATGSTPVGMYKELIQMYNEGRVDFSHVKTVNLDEYAGLNGEDHQMMLETARELSRLSLHSIKIHLLHVLKGTVMAEQLQRGEFRLLEREEYVNIVCDQLELLPPELIVQRVTGDGEKEALVGPQWSLKKLCVLNEIDKELVRRDSWQGKFYQK